MAVFSSNTFFSQKIVIILFNITTTLIYKKKKNPTSLCLVDGHRCWRCVGWLPPSPASRPRGSSPLSCPGWWPGWECGAAVKQSVIAEGCWMFSATCCCCCGRGTCIQMSRCHCCFPCIPTLVSDITPNSPCVQLESILLCERCLFLKRLVFKMTYVV